MPAGTNPGGKVLTMWIETALRILLGATLGAIGGFVLGRARACSGGTCNVKANLAFSIVAGACFGGAVAYAIGTS